MTWPILRAIKRIHPDAELHFLTRSRFASAADGLEVISHFWQLNTPHLLNPLVEDQLEVSVKRVTSFVNELRSQKFDWVINLTFSPTSSYLTHFIANKRAKTSGYSRDEEGHLFISDPASGYFYSQVGINRHNRLHLTDIFSAVVGIDYHPEDWRAPVVENLNMNLPKQYLTLHIGASEKGKRLNGFMWASIIREFLKKSKDRHIVLVGSPDEYPVSEEIVSQVPGEYIVNLVGQTKLRDLFMILSCSELLVGCDSAPIHIAALTDTPVYNLSFGNVNFWETGPKSSMSFIDRIPTIDSLHTAQIGQHIYEILQGNSPPRLITRHDGIESYVAPQAPSDAFIWNLIKALYFNEAFPLCEDYTFYEAAVKIQETTRVVLKSIADLHASAPDSLHKILEASDAIFKKIGTITPKAQPLIGWLESQKIMIRPGPRSQVLQDTLEIYETLNKVINLYIPEDEVQGQGGENHG